MIQKEIYLIRHGETELNRLGIVQGGGIDAPLNVAGRWQAQAFFEKYADVPFEKIITSDLIRTHQTVELFIEKGIRWQQETAIRELNWGVQEGKVPTADSNAAFRSVINAWKNGDLAARIEGGESAEELENRLSVFVEQLAFSTENKILICAHGRVMRGLLCLLNRQPMSRMEYFQHSNTCLYLGLNDGENFRFIKQNDTTHLREYEIRLASNV
jgi:probable phosphoglycerate mutase